jgi:multiple sugar transport system substrate-binding protein
VPVYGDVRTAVYRGDLVQQVGGGTGPDDLPKTWDDFRALAGKLAKKNGGPLDAPFFGGQDKSVGLMQVYSQLLYQAGGNYFDADGKSALSGESGTRALDYLLSFYKDGLANPNLVYQGTGRRPLVAGIAAMTYSSWNVQQNAVLYAPEVEKDVIAGLPLTADAGGKPVGMAWINKFAISSHTKDPDGAWALLSYLTSKDIASRFGELYGGLPSRSDLEDAAYLKTVSPGFVMSSKYAAALPPNPNLLQIQQQVNIALQAAIRQSAPPKQLLADLDQKIDSINAK